MATVSGQDAPINGVGSSSSGGGGGGGLSLRERMRLKAQQQLQDKALASSPTGTAADTINLVAVDVESDQDDLGSLTLGRTKRQAALKRPASYSIDPLDDSSRLTRHPNKLPTSLARYAATSGSKTKDIGGLLREQQRRTKRGTDADGFSRADAIALSMEQERLERMGIAFSDVDSDDAHSHAGQGSRSSSLNLSKSNRASLLLSRTPLSTHGKERESTVRELSPTIPSFLWSSQSEAGDSEAEADRNVDVSKAKQQLSKSLAAVGADEDEKQLALDILQSDVGGSRTVHAQDPKGRITFYRPGKVLAPIATFFCPLPSITRDSRAKESTPVADSSAAAAAAAAAAPSAAPATQASSPQIVDELDWEPLARCILLAGSLPPSLELDKRQIRRILVWLAISFVLERHVMQSLLISTLFQSLVFQSESSHYTRQLDSAIPRALTDIVRRVPRILNRIGMEDVVFEKCFPDNSSVTDVPCFTVAQRKHLSSQTQDAAGSSSPSAEFADFKVYLTQTERDDILIHLAQMLDMVACASYDPAFIEENLSIFAGYVSSMAIACAATTNHAVSNAVGSAFSSIFAAAAREEAEEGDALTRLQAEVCRRTFSALSDNSIAVRSRLVTVLPGEGKEIGAVKRWLAWCALTEHVAQARCVTTTRTSPSDVVPSSDPYADEGEEDGHEAQSKEETEHWRRTEFQALTLDLEMLAEAIDASNPDSPFRVAPVTLERATPKPRSRSNSTSNSTSPQTTRSCSTETAADHHHHHRGSSSSSSSTSFETLIAATQLASLALRDLPVHMCTFSPPSRTAGRSTPTPTRPSNGEPVLDAAARKTWPKALRLALEPYLASHPVLDATRVATLHTLVDKLSTVNGRIRDNRGNVILQTLAKDRLQTLCHSLEYQLDLFSSRGSGIASSFLK